MESTYAYTVSVKIFDSHFFFRFLLDIYKQAKNFILFSSSCLLRYIQKSICCWCVHSDDTDNVEASLLRCLQIITLAFEPQISHRGKKKKEFYRVSCASSSHHLTPFECQRKACRGDREREREKALWARHNE